MRSRAAPPFQFVNLVFIYGKGLKSLERSLFSVAVDYYGVNL